MNDFNETLVFVRDAEGTLVFANDAFARLMCRASAADVIGKRASDFFPADTADMLLGEDAEILSKGEPRRVERKFVCSDGVPRVFGIRKIPLTLGGVRYLLGLGDVAGRSPGGAGSAVPVPADVRARFFSAISHDVRTPLNAIVGYAQLLQNAQTSAQSQEAAMAIGDGARNLISAIDGVMMMLSPDAAGGETALETFNVSEATLHVVESYAEAAGANDVEFHLSSTQLPLVEFAGAAYKDILARLLENAVRHTPAGHIEVRTAFEKGTLTVQVKDMSRGMLPSEIAEVMTPDAAQDANRCPGSSTLCLAVAKRLTEKLNGAFALSSVPNEGTTVTVTFSNVKTTDGRKRAEFARTQKMRTMRIEDPFRFDKRILVVDDRLVNVRILSLLLKALGFGNVVAVTSAEKALETVRAEKIDLVLTDLMMPGMDGRELLREIRKLPGRAKLPVYAVTADANAKTTCAHDGFAGILLKPITKEMLREVL